MFTPDNNFVYLIGRKCLDKNGCLSSQRALSVGAILRPLLTKSEIRIVSRCNQAMKDWTNSSICTNNCCFYHIVIVCHNNWLVKVIVVNKPVATKRKQKMNQQSDRMSFKLSVHKSLPSSMTTKRPFQFANAQKFAATLFQTARTQTLKPDRNLKSETTNEWKQKQKQRTDEKTTILVDGE